MNILQEFINQNKQFVILILGYQGSKKSSVAKMLNNYFKFKLININDYYKDDTFIKKKIDNIDFKIYENTENYDWTILSNDVVLHKSNGVILYGNIIDIDKIKFDINFIFFLSITPTIFKDYLKKNKKFENIEDNYLELYINKYIIPLYDDLKNKIKINKFYNIKEKTNITTIYDEMVKYLILNVKKNINSY